MALVQEAYVRYPHEMRRVVGPAAGNARCCDLRDLSDFFFSSLRTNRAEYPILNLEQGPSVSGRGRMILYVGDVDAFWKYLKERGFDPATPRDASWGERYFHMPDPDDHELSFACSLRPAA
jgi:hypothetical protein